MVEQSTTQRPQTSIELPAGPFAPGDLQPEHPDAVALIVTEGLVMRELLVSSTVAAELAGPGDVVGLRRPEGELVPSALRFTAVVPSRVVPLDPELQGRLRTNADLAVRLLGRAVHQTERLALHRAVLQLPHVEQRVLAVLWLLAERWGRVTPAGVVVPISLTHQTLGALVGARRPTVSLALKALAAEGLVTRRRDGGWVLRHGSAEDAFTPVGTPDATPLPALVSVPPAAEPRRPDPALARTTYDLEQLRMRVDATRRTLITRAEAAEVLDRCRRTREELLSARERREGLPVKRS